MNPPITTTVHDLALEMLATGPQSHLSIAQEFWERKKSAYAAGMQFEEIAADLLHDAAKTITYLNCEPILDTPQKAEVFQTLSKVGDLDAIADGWEVYDSIKYRAPVGVEKIVPFPG